MKNNVVLASIIFFYNHILIRSSKNIFAAITKWLNLSNAMSTKTFFLCLYLFLGLNFFLNSLYFRKNNDFE